ncbi:MAG TPA: TetR/AcrR family transcriptional regulator [Acidimicrobiales bacterium]|nr:TetR/AcrR family transcriptional regulator [Acidimicrobiales bacterium]
MSSAAGAVTGARLTAAQRKQQFLDVAAQIVVEQGADTVTMEAVAARAGVSKALSYRYFSNAGALLLELFEREVVDLDRQIRAAVETADSFEDKVRATFQGWGTEMSDRGRLLGRLWQVSVSAGPLLEARRRRDREVYEFWGRMIEEEYELPTPVAQTAAAILVQGTAGLLASLFSGRGEQDELIDIYVCMTLGALDRLAEQHASTTA